MHFLTSSISLLVLASSAVASYTNSTLTTEYTVTDYTTYCPETTTFTVTKCSQDKCHPSPVTVTSPGTVTVTGTIVCDTPPPAVITSTKSSVVGGTVTQTTVTDFTTYCPESTVFTVSTCSAGTCKPTTVSVPGKATVTISGEVVCPTTVGGSTTPVVVVSTPSATYVPTTYTATGFTTYCPESTVLTITTCSAGTCAPATLSPTAGETVTIPGEVLKTSSVPTTVTSAPTPVFPTTSAPTTVAAVSTTAPAVSTPSTAVSVLQGGANSQTVNSILLSVFAIALGFFA
ncbi:uncharacterized protein LODBEIA_P17920 [Lodderomyces beijingensis]|uniref:Uncharacterized protein n=1 Tax=Lodderomyces beijingensis TaxID=1775926 RepID=A0ABP0ZHD1_9ASCO